MRLVLTGGGTGGHVYPALSVAAELRRPETTDGPTPELLYVGSRGGMEQGIVAKAGLDFAAVSAAGLRGRSPFGFVAGVGRLAAGLIQSLALLRARPADAVLATGGYVCVPVVLAAWARGIPVLLYLPDVEPGLAVRFLSHFAARIAVTSLESRRFLGRARLVETGYPVRPEVREASRTGSRAHLGLPADGIVMLVVGGSRGARTLNQATVEALPRLLELADVIHVRGREDAAGTLGRPAELPPGVATHYHPFGFLHSADMAAALAAADLAIARAGASVLGEFPALGLPSILVPYPHAGANQRPNAELLARNGAAAILEDEAVRAGALLTTVQALLGSPVRLRAMGEAASRLDRPDAARNIARELVELARQRGTQK